MNKTNLIFVFFCVLIFLGSMYLGGGAGLYYNSIAVMVVFPGIIGATFLSYPYSRIKYSYHVARNAYTKELKSPSEVISTLMDMAVMSRYDGFLSLENYPKKKNISFLDRAVSLLIDNYSDEEIREVLTSEMQFFKIRRQQSERLFRHMANLAPAFGISGSVIGLISMISNINDSQRILETIPIALTSTLYGILLSYFILNPIAENIYNRTHKELLLQRIIMAGVITMRAEKNSYKLETKLTSYLTPSDRGSVEYNLKRVRRRRIGNLRNVSKSKP